MRCAVLSKTYGVQDNEINRAIGSNWLKGLASRVHEAGCKFDYVLVIEGLQGSYKSTSLKILVGTNWHIEITISPNDKDFFLAMKGKLVVEFAEGETLSRSETKNLKSVITRDVDDIRLPYDRLTKSLPRRCVFAMTTNESQYLKDTTGNRRWLPVRVPDGHSADIEWLKENREQLLAEAYYRVTVLKEKTFEFPTEIEELQEDRVIMPDCVDAVLDYYNSLTWEEVKLGVITTEGVYNYINKNKSIEIQMRVMSPKEGNDIRKVLEGKLHLENKKISLNGFRRHRWLPTSKTKPPQTVVDENGFVVFPTDTEKVSAMSIEKEVKEMVRRAKDPYMVLPTEIRFVADLLTSSQSN
jgi:predicted P-loop ATPase